MRRARRLRRLGSLEWFEIAYRVYLAALVGGGVVLWLSGLVSDDPATAAQIAALNEHGPAVIGAGAALASLLWFAGLGLGARRLAPLLGRPAAWRVVDAAIAAVMASLAVSLLAS